MNLYKILGLKKTATDDEIKQAYRELAKQYHPDVGGDQEKFKEINEAYTVLSDPLQRKAYDELGTVPGTPEFEIYNILVQAFKGKLQEAGNTGRGISIFQLRGENTNAIRTIKENNSQLKQFLSRIRALRGVIKHNRSRKSKFDAFQKACELIIEDVEGSIQTNKKALERAILVEEQLQSYEDIKRDIITSSFSAEDIIVSLVRSGRRF